MSKVESSFSATIRFGGLKRYRMFPALPRPGDAINLTDSEGAHELEVETVWFDDHHGEDDMEVFIDCKER